MFRIDQAFYKNGTPKHAIPYTGDLIDGVAKLVKKDAKIAEQSDK